MFRYNVKLFTGINDIYVQRFFFIGFFYKINIYNIYNIYNREILHD